MNCFFCSHCVDRECGIRSLAFVRDIYGVLDRGADRTSLCLMEQCKRGQVISFPRIHTHTIGLYHEGKKKDLAPCVRENISSGSLQPRTAQGWLVQQTVQIVAAHDPTFFVRRVVLKSGGLPAIAAHGPARTNAFSHRGAIALGDAGYRDAAITDPARSDRYRASRPPHPNWPAA